MVEKFDMSKVTVLDHGYIHLVEAWGSEERIIEAARMSTGKGFQGWGRKHREECKNAPNGPFDGCICERNVVQGDEKLLRYLYKNAHATPFEMAGAIVEVKAPIFVFREWHRHRTQSYNEMSARYTPLPDENYMPTVERLRLQGGANKQAQGTGAVLSWGSRSRDAAHRFPIAKADRPFATVPNTGGLVVRHRKTGQYLRNVCGRWVGIPAIGQWVGVPALGHGREL